jgi:hypothetical protein
MKVANIAAIMSLVLVIAGCVRPPMPDAMTSPSTAEIVRRLKCELATAIDAKQSENPRFGFLTQWSAKVHLTLVADDQSVFSPGATFIEPLSVAGTSRSLGVGAGLTTQAVKQEDIDFFISFPEMLGEMSDRKNWSGIYKYCQRSDGVLLESELGLKSLLDRALDPVGKDVLYTGINNAGLTGGRPKVPANEIANIRTALLNLSKLRELPKGSIAIENAAAILPAGRKIDQLNQIIKEFQAETTADPSKSSENERKEAEAKRERDRLTENLAKAKLYESHARMLVRDVVNPLSEIAAASNSSVCQAAISDAKNAATASAAVVAINKFAVDSSIDVASSDKALNETEKAEKATYGHASLLLRTVTDCGPKEKPRSALYDPIDVIGETVNFYVTYSGSLAPTWKLARVSAPFSSTLLSGTRRNTNTLILTMGRPSVSSSGALTSSTAMDNQVLSQILSQAITLRTSQ